MLRHPKNFVHVVLCWRAGKHFRLFAVYSVRTDWCLPRSDFCDEAGMYFFCDISYITSARYEKITSETDTVVIVLQCDFGGVLALHIGYKNTHSNKTNAKTA